MEDAHWAITDVWRNGYLWRSSEGFDKAGFKVSMKLCDSLSSCLRFTDYLATGTFRIIPGRMTPMLRLSRLRAATVVLYSVAME